MEKGYAGQGTQLGTVFIGVILAIIGLMSVISDWSNAQMPPPTPEAIVEAQPPAAMPVAENTRTAAAAITVPPPGEKAQDALKNLVQAWRAAWASRDTDAYLAFYAADFQGAADTPEEWRANRKRIIGQAKSIDIQIGDTKIDVKGDDLATLTFPLDYVSNRFEDHGIKVLELRHRDGKWLIEGETFIAD